ncbi:MAG: heme exporter protein CcmB [Alcanivorax sediminis]|uniref:heme exporter protein CcmB n=1 Tax=Alcanivorax sediminis TaxID=2663008 RepID=UPI003C36C5B1
MTAFRAALSRELLVLWRSPAEIINPLFFFVMVISLFPLAISPKPETLSLIAPGVLWVAALLAVMLSLDGLFRRDQESGVLEQLLTSPVMTVVPVTAKLLAHWLLTGLPLVLVSPVLAHMLQLPDRVLGVVMLSLLLGTPALTVIGAIGSALTVGLNRGGILLAVLVLPLYIPVLIFGAGVIRTAVEGGPVSGVLAILGALLALTASLGPLAVAAGLKISSGN